MTVPTIRIIDKASVVSCPNPKCDGKVKSSSKGTTHCPKCNAAVKNPKGTSKAETRHNGPQGGGFYPSKKPKGPASGGSSGSQKKPSGGNKDSAPSNLTPEQKKAYQQAYNKTLAATNGDKKKAHAAGMAAAKAVGGGSASGGGSAKPSGNTKPNPFKKSEFVIETEVAKTDDDQMQAFGWAYVSEKNGQPVVDHSGEWAPIEELEKGAYRYNLLEKRESGEMHFTKGCGTLIESVVFTEEKYRAMGFPEEVAKSLPKGWWIGYQLEDTDVWKKVKSGEYPMLSIHGTAMRQEIDVDPGTSGLDMSASDLVLAAKMEVAGADSYHQLSKNARAYIHVQGTAIRTDRMSKGVGPQPHGPSVKCPDIYEALKREGKTKTQAAKISNECFSSGDCNCH